MTGDVLKIVRKWLPLFILSAAILIIILDTTLLTVSMREIAADTNTDFTGVQWVITCYSLTLAALTITGGKLGDLFGRKRIFIVGAVLFGIGSFITSISPNLRTILIGESLLEGVGAALMLPATSSLLISNYKGPDRAIAYGIWGGIAATAAVLGPVVGGIITTYYGWRWGFRINIVIVLLLLVGSRWIVDTQAVRIRQKLDIFGVALSASGLLALVYGIIETSNHGWFLEVKDGGLSIAFVMMFTGIVLLLAFAKWQQRQSESLKPSVLDHKLFVNKQFTSGIIVVALFSLAMVGILFGLMLFIQSSLKLNALQSGMSLLPMSIAVLIFAPLSGYLTKYRSSKQIIQVGISTSLLSSVVIYLSISPTTTLLSLAPGLVLLGVGAGLVVAQASNLTLSAIDIDHAGAASGVNNTFRQLGTTLGLAIVGTIMVSTISTASISQVKQSQVIPFFAKPIVVREINTLKASGLSLEKTGQQERIKALPLALQNELKRIAHISLVEGLQRTVIFMALFLLLSLVASRALPNKPKLSFIKALPLDQ